MIDCGSMFLRQIVQRRKTARYVLMNGKHLNVATAYHLFRELLSNTKKRMTYLRLGTTACFSPDI